MKSLKDLEKEVINISSRLNVLERDIESNEIDIKNEIKKEFSALREELNIFENETIQNVSQYYQSLRANLLETFLSPFEIFCQLLGKKTVNSFFPSPKSLCLMPKIQISKSEEEEGKEEESEDKETKETDFEILKNKWTKLSQTHNSFSPEWQDLRLLCWEKDQTKSNHLKLWKIINFRGAYVGRLFKRETLSDFSRKGRGDRIIMIEKPNLKYSSSIILFTSEWSGGCDLQLKLTSSNGISIGSPIREVREEKKVLSYWQLEDSRLVKDQKSCNAVLEEEISLNNCLLLKDVKEKEVLPLCCFRKTIVTSLFPRFGGEVTLSGGRLVQWIPEKDSVFVLNLRSQTVSTFFLQTEEKNLIFGVQYMQAEKCFVGFSQIIQLRTAISKIKIWEVNSLSLLPLFVEHAHFAPILKKCPPIVTKNKIFICDYFESCVGVSCYEILRDQQNENQLCLCFHSRTPLAIGTIVGMVAYKNEILILDNYRKITILFQKGNNSHSLPENIAYNPSVKLFSFPNGVYVETKDRLLVKIYPLFPFPSSSSSSSSKVIPKGISIWREANVDILTAPDQSVLIWPGAISWYCCRKRKRIIKKGLPFERKIPQNPKVLPTPTVNPISCFPSIISQTVSSISTSGQYHVANLERIYPPPCIFNSGSATMGQLSFTGSATMGQLSVPKTMKELSSVGYSRLTHSARVLELPSTRVKLSAAEMGGEKEK